MIACMATVNDNGYSQIVDSNVRQNPFSKHQAHQYTVIFNTGPPIISLQVIEIFQRNKGLDVYAVHVISWMFPQSIILIVIQLIQHSLIWFINIYTSSCLSCSQLSCYALFKQVYLIKCMYEPTVVASQLVCNKKLCALASDQVWLCHWPCSHTIYIY